MDQMIHKAVYLDVWIFISGISGEFTSPNFPDKYPINIECTWTIMGGIGKRITVAFPDFELEDSFSCDRDAVRGYNGMAASRPEIFEYVKNICHYKYS